jgi:2-oxoglutarate dehydrogenase E2 component (dihydrolipoamide succinyltransferase)
VAEADGVLSIKVAEGSTVAIGAVVATIDTAAAVAKAEDEKPKVDRPQRPAEVFKAKERGAVDTPAGRRPPPEKPAAPPPEDSPVGTTPRLLAPSARRLIDARQLAVEKITATGPGGRITKGDVLLYIEKTASMVATPKPTPDMAVSAEEPARRKPMSPIRQRIAARLLEAKRNTAMLTTFNEIDMQHVLALRVRYQDGFQQKFGVKLGLMSFFIKASIAALQEFPQLNAFVEDKDIIEHDYYHIGVAVGSARGLVVPVIRHADRLSFAGLEQAIVDYVEKINQNRLALADLEGGTFTISNGGIYGSLLSTPILNTPQSGILGMHKIEKRPVVIEDQVVIRPMMYVALSYDHRIVDGREAVSFLKRIKECVENPERIMMEI